jgi:hypothetical protein
MSGRVFRERLYALCRHHRRVEPHRPRHGEDQLSSPANYFSACHPPRKRGIQYAAAFRFHRFCSGILGYQVKPGDDILLDARAFVLIEIDLPDGLLRTGRVKPHIKKYFCCLFVQIGYSHDCLVPDEGRIAIVRHAG